LRHGGGKMKINRNIVSIFILLSIINNAFGQEINGLETYSSGTSIIKSKGELIKEPLTNVSIIKMNDGSTLDYFIKTPIVDSFEFVLALDSSGSLGKGNNEDETQKKAIEKAVPMFLQYIKQNYSSSKFKISIVSWDDNVDFAIGGYNNSNPIDEKYNSENIVAKMIPLDDVINITDNIFNNAFITSEYEQTDLSTAIKTSLKVINNTPYSKYDRVLRFVILVTGNGEFNRCNEDLINMANKNRYGIYSIGIDTAKSSMIRKELKNISGDDKKIEYIGPIYQEVNRSLSDLLYEALRVQLEKAMNESIATNVKITESFYPYYRPKSVYADGKSIGFYLRNNTDNTTTITFELPDGLRANSESEIRIDSEIVFENLPISVTNNRTPVILCSPKSSTEISKIEYYWLHLPNKITEKLSENQMDIKFNQIGSAGSKSQSPFSRLTSPLMGFALRLWPTSLISFLEAKRG
jgi:hypothetical protein